MSRAGRSTQLAPSEARRLALRAQGLGRRSPGERPDSRALLQALRRLGLLQLDSVSVLVRAHYLPLFTRLGPYDRAELDRLAGHHGAAIQPCRRKTFEYWAHEASLLPVELQPLLRWRMERAAAGDGVWSGVAEIARRHPDLVERVEREVVERGPLGVSAFDQPPRRAGGWWGWGDSKRALEWLFWTGRLTAAGRRGFERLYDLPERVLPRAVLGRPTPPEAEAQRALLRHSARALGAATAADLRDYFRLPLAAARARIAELVEAGELLPLSVRGWRQPAFAPADLVVPRRIEGSALLAPFDPLVWNRDRTLRLFGFDYRLEIYTPAARRRHGYYVLPFLLHDRLVARVDLKAERARGMLLVRSAHLEPKQDDGQIAEHLAFRLAELARWLELEVLAVEPQGELAPALRSALATTRP